MSEQSETKNPTPQPGAPGGVASDRSTPHAGAEAEPQRPHAADDQVVDGEVVEPEADATAEGDAPESGEPAEQAAPEPAPEEPDWKDRYLRSVAELDNVRKRARRDAAAGETRGISRLARELLPAMDNLDRALAHIDEAPDGDPQLIEGLRIVHRELHAALAQAGIESYDPTGQPFDPRFHEALSQQPADEGTLPGTVVTVYQAGYRLGDDVLRAAKVVVAG